MTVRNNVNYEETIRKGAKLETFNQSENGAWTGTKSVRILEGAFEVYGIWNDVLNEQREFQHWLKAYAMNINGEKGAE